LYFNVIVLNLIVCLFPQAIALSESRQEKRTAESVRAAKSAELEVVVRFNAEKIAELETEKESIAASYRRLSEKHKAFIEKPEQEKTELAEIHVIELVRLHGDLDL
jgi:hypothetical protein